MTELDPAIARFSVVPDYFKGFVFHWSLRGGFNDEGPWKFVVEMGRTQEGEWTPISPELEDVFAWRAPDPPRVNKDSVLFFRLVLKTADGVYATDARTPYGDLDRREFLIARDIMRREVLHMRKLAGTECDVWSVSNYGRRCTRCIDPETGHSRDSHCPVCFGTGFVPPYRGPFRVWCSFSENNQHRMTEGNEGNGVDEQKMFSVRMVSSVPVKKNDVLHDVASGKRHYVQEVQISAELRRVPIVQTVVVSEIAVTDPAYKIGGMR